MGKMAGRFIVKPGAKFRLAKVDAGDKSGFADKDAAKQQLADDADAIDALQDKLYAEGRRALLVILQGIDCSGKDGTVRHVFGACDPIGIAVTGFGVPSEQERDHDFLWRIHQACPQRGRIGIFNRSHYEDVVVVKVKQLAPPGEIDRRYEQINRFERMLSENGTRILKFMLHVSQEEQAMRLQERLDVATKQWKFNPGDLEDRKLWDDFMAAYETALSRCSTPHAPWHVIPADRNWLRNAAIAAIVRETLEEMDPQYPKLDFDPKTVKII